MAALALATRPPLLRLQVSTATSNGPVHPRLLLCETEVGDRSGREASPDPWMNDYDTSRDECCAPKASKCCASRTSCSSRTRDLPRSGFGWRFRASRPNPETPHPAFGHLLPA